MVHEIEWNYELIRKRTLNITVFDVRQVEIRYCGGSACVGSVTRNVLKGSRGAWERCTCAVPVDEPDSSAWLSVWGVSMCRFGFLTLAASKHPKFNITTALEDTVYENCGGKGTGMMGGPTVVSMQCAASQGNVVWQSNYALKAMNGAGNDIIACKTSKNQHCDSSGGHIIRKSWRTSDRGGRWADCSVHEVHR